MRPPVLRLYGDEMIVDAFAGGGGASAGIEQALGRSPDIAINHNPRAIAMHAINHPKTRHLCGDVFDVDPREACRGRRVGLLWASPDCTHFSKARGGKPASKKIRLLAWVVIRWARQVKPRVICLENVEEFEDWGPLDESDRPDRSKRGLTFRRWVGSLRAAGYAVEWRQLRACDYGAPTSRKRLFVIARCDGLPIIWPEPTHGKHRRPYRTAAECIEWGIECPSIFERKRPLAEKTEARIARGIDRFVLRAQQPFLIPVTHVGDTRVHALDEPLRTITGAHRGEQALVGATLIQTSWGERERQAPRVPGLDKPIGTIVAGGVKHALVAGFFAKHYGDRAGGWAGGQAAEAPLGTITRKDHHSLVAAHMMPTVRARGAHLAEVRTFLMKYYGTGSGVVSPQLPLGTITARDRFGVVRVAGDEWHVVDIGMRMLVPRELFRAQGFPDSYVIDRDAEGRPFTKSDQVAMCGNSVPPDLARAIVAANLGAKAEAA